MNIKLLDLSHQKEWNESITRLPIEYKDIYFTPEYYSLYKNLGDGKANCFIFEKDGEIALYPFLLNSVNDLGFELDKEYFDIQGAYGYNGIISSTYEDPFIISFYKAFTGFLNETNVIAEFTRFHPFMNNQLFSNNKMDIIEDRKTVFLDLDQSYAEIWKKSYSGINRNMINKAMKTGIEIRSADRPEDIDIFASMYLETMRKVNADEYYFFSNSYFKQFVELLGPNQKILLAYCDGEIISGALIMTYGIYAHYHLAARNPNAKTNGAANLLLDHAVKFAQSIGCKKYHFGGGSTKEEKNQLFQFKANFSKTFMPFFIGKKVHNSNIYQEVIRQWVEKYPEKVNKHKNLLLKYRN